MLKKAAVMSALAIAVLCLSAISDAQTDPGVQSGSRGTGAALSSVQSDDNAGILAMFNDGQSRFQEVESVSGAGDTGLGPRFNSNSCSSCHAQPAVGGSGAANNPQATFISTGVAPKDSTPYFVTPTGPTVEARFPFYFNRNGSANLNAPNGGVEDLFTVTGRPDAGSCSLTQPSFSAARAANNIIFRIPTATFGSGLIENIDDSTLLSNQAKNLNNRLGISGTFNHNGNDGTISRFGWKAQNKSLHIFSGEAYNVEMGISNLLFTQDRPLPGEEGGGGSGQTGFPSNCLNLSGKGYPEDTMNPGQSGPGVLDDASAFANFMRTLAPPATGPVVLNGSTVPTSSISNGAALFSSIGCAACHNPTPGTTQKSNITGSLSNAAVNAYSDLEIHHMGSGLTDNVAQGGAGGDQFRTAPLWGLGQRIFLLHDGRTTSLITAIRAHNSRGSEASTVEGNYQNLSPSQQQDLLNFLRSL
ncbi:MAG TPA: di-heme oxidoredictase family protein [Candidatus Eisenbacteria bacterium]|nr:di-heme oxidoredictase family protein [Candidatus Eisenbacteria bacterium]